MNTKGDLLYDLDRRLKDFHFKSTPLTCSWQGSNIVHRVCNKEMEKKHKSTEERLIYRLQLWADVCGMERINNSTPEPIRNGSLHNGNGKYRNRMFSKKENVTRLKKTELPLEIAFYNNSHKPASNLSDTLTSTRGININKVKTVSTSYSSDNLYAYCSSSSSSSTLNASSEVEDNIETSKTKRKFKFFTFRKKAQNSTKCEEKKQKSSSTVRKKKRSVKSMNDALDDYDLEINSRIRPSIFDMKGLKGNIPDMPTFYGNDEIERQYCRTDSLSRRRYEKFSPIRSLSKLSTSLDGSSFLLQVKDNNMTNRSCFYYPAVEQTEIGYV